MGMNIVGLDIYVLDSGLDNIGWISTATSCALLACKHQKPIDIQYYYVRRVCVFESNMKLLTVQLLYCLTLALLLACKIS